MSNILVQYGGGNIGRGFIAVLFSLAGYEVKFIDVNKQLINELNQRGEYPVEIVSKAGSEEIIIKNVTGIDGTDINAVTDAIAEASIMSTAVGVNILPRIAPVIAAGLKKRWHIGNMAPLNIIICENLIDADKLLFKLITEILSDSESIIFNKTIGLVEASIGRMVPVMTEEMKKGDNLRVCVEKYGELPVDRSSFKGEVPPIPHMHPFSPFEFYIKRKLFVHNLGHALTAYMGYIDGYEYIWQAINNPIIKLLVQRAMMESAQALSLKFDIKLIDIMEHINDLQLRFANEALGDTVSRVGRDTQRKLSQSDRFTGAIKLCQEQGIEPIYISVGIACGLFFDCEGDSGTKSVRELLESTDVDNVLKTHCGINPDSNSYKYIKEYYNILKVSGGFAELLTVAESMKQDELNCKNII